MTMRILLGYSYYNNPVDIKLSIEAWLTRLRSAGFKVDGFPLTLNAPGPRLSWPDLNARWKRGDKELLSMYEALATTLEDYDVFVNWNGINLHPDFVRQLPTFKVYGCFDDPESSEDLSKPVAWAYDLSMVGNVAELDSYRAWGINEVRFWPLGFRVDDYDASLTKEKILSGEREIDIALLCERVSGWRADRLDKFSTAFPSGAYFGRGWPNGFLPETKRVELYQRTKIGPNFHNSTGPINFRTYILPANGILQLCDNKSHLGKIYEIGKEVVGFNTVEEAIDLARYYLHHDEERRQIASAGWERAIRDYNEASVFGLVEKYVREVQKSDFKKDTDRVIRVVKEQRKKTVFNRVAYTLSKPIVDIKNAAIEIYRRLQ